MKDVSFIIHEIHAVYLSFFIECVRFVITHYGDEGTEKIHDNELTIAQVFTKYKFGSRSVGPFNLRKQHFAFLVLVCASMLMCSSHCCICRWFVAPILRNYFAWFWREMHLNSIDFLGCACGTLWLHESIHAYCMLFAADINPSNCMVITEYVREGLGFTRIHVQGCLSRRLAWHTRTWTKSVRTPVMDCILFSALHFTRWKMQPYCRSKTSIL